MSTLKLPINAIYLATEGEGVLLGHPQVFIRLQGCAIGCLNCDSKDTWDFNENNSKTISQVITDILEIGPKIRRASITGGDPLHPKFSAGLKQLIFELRQRNFFISIEASGMRFDDEIFDIVNWISFDFKTPSTGVTTPLKNIEKLIKQFDGKSQIKAVIENRYDFDKFFEVFDKLKDIESSVPWVVTPAYTPGEEFPQERFVSILNWNYEKGAPFRVIAQQHKWFFGTKERMV